MTNLINKIKHLSSDIELSHKEYLRTKLADILQEYDKETSDNIRTKGLPHTIIAGDKILGPIRSLLTPYCEVLPFPNFTTEENDDKLILSWENEKKGFEHLDYHQAMDFRIRMSYLKDFYKDITFENPK
jgi:hypothetical protein